MNKELMITAVAMVVVFFIFATIVFIVYNELNVSEYDLLQERLDEKTNVSDDYRKGWMDCIEELEKIRKMATNMTASNTLYINLKYICTN